MMRNTESTSRATNDEIELRRLDSLGELVTLDDPPLASRHRFFSSVRRKLLFIITFGLPVLAAGLYLFLIASDRYVTEARFIVRSAASNGYESVSSLVESNGLSRATDETYAVNEYILSRDALELLAGENHYRDILARPEADFINRFPNFYSRDNKEELLKAYRRLVRAYVDAGTGISSLEVVAFRPEDARQIAIALLNYAEALINRLNARAYQDALLYANLIVEGAQKNFSAAQAKLTAYRNSSGMVDTTRESAAAIDSIAKLSLEVAQIEASIAQKQALSPSSPGLASLRERARAYRDEINLQRVRLVGKDSSMASKLGFFEQLLVEREIAAKSLASAERSRDQARHDAEQQHLYLQVIVAPSIPDEATYPKRILWFLMTVAAATAVYTCCRTFISSALEHTT